MTGLKFILDTLEAGGEEVLTDSHILQLEANPHYEEVYIRWKKTFGIADARKLKAIQSVHGVQIWTTVTRSAVNSLAQFPNLKTLNLLELSGSSRLVGFDAAETLEEFGCLRGVNGSDLLEIAKLPRVRKLTAHNSRITERSLEALLANPSLSALDFEGANFSDHFATMVSKSKTITALELGSTEITNVGLQAICTMSQLRRLDVWSTDVVENDLKILALLPKLEYLSIGGHEGQTKLTAAGVMETLYEIPSLKMVWLDGVNVTRQELEKLKERFEKVWVSSVSDG